MLAAIVILFTMFVSLVLTKLTLDRKFQEQKEELELIAYNDGLNAYLEEQRKIELQRRAEIEEAYHLFLFQCQQQEENQEGNQNV